MPLPNSPQAGCKLYAVFRFLSELTAQSDRISKVRKTDSSAQPDWPQQQDSISSHSKHLFNQNADNASNQGEQTCCLYSKVYRGKARQSQVGERLVKAYFPFYRSPWLHALSQVPACLILQPKTNAYIAKGKIELHMVMAMTMAPSCD